MAVQVFTVSLGLRYSRHSRHDKEGNTNEAQLSGDDADDGYEDEEPFSNHSYPANGITDGQSYRNSPTRKRIKYGKKIGQYL